MRVLFNFDKLDHFIQTARKYMVLRGNLTQSELCQKISVNPSQLSRFLNKQTRDIDPGLVAKIVIMLEIPRSEIIDFIEEESTQAFLKLLEFQQSVLSPGSQGSHGSPSESQLRDGQFGHEDGKVYTSADISIHQGAEKRSVPFGGSNRPGGPTSQQSSPSTTGALNANMSIRDKLQSLTPGQRFYLEEFLSLNREDKDLLVDVGMKIMSHFKLRS